MSDTSREAFEAHMRSLNVTTRFARFVTEPTDYKGPTVQRAWEVWQASRAAALEEAAKVCDETWVEPGDLQCENCHAAAQILRALAAKG